MISTVVNIFNLQVDIQCGSAYEAFENGGVFDLKTRRPLLSRLLPLAPWCSHAHSGGTRNRGRRDERPVATRPDSLRSWEGIVLPQIHMLKSQLPVPQYVALFGGKVFTEVIKLK